MDHTCANLEGLFPYMDDSRVASLDKETYLQHFDKFDATLVANGVAINLKNVFLSFQLWNSWATGFRQQDWP